MPESAEPPGTSSAGMLKNSILRATFDALKSQMHPKDVAAARGIKYSTLQARRGNAVAAAE